MPPDAGSRRLRVVAAAILRDGTVLVARRRRPVVLAGGWEFPGGKVEHGEDDATALARECREELGVDITVGTCLGTAVDERIELTLYAAQIDTGEPAAHDDHDAVRWASGADLGSLAWLPIDEELVPAVVAALQ